VFKLAHEFTFQAVHTVPPQHETISCPAKAHIHAFTGQLIFKGTVLNEYGTLCSESDLQQFGNTLNEMNNLADSWSLELIAKELYNNAVTLFPNLNGVLLYMTDAPFRMAEYSRPETIEAEYDDSMLAASSRAN